MLTTRVIALCLSVLLLTEGATAAGEYALRLPLPGTAYESIYRQSAFQPRLLTPLLSYAETLSANLCWVMASFVTATGGLGAISSPDPSGMLVAGVGSLFFFRAPLFAAFESIAEGRAISSTPLIFSEQERHKHIRRYRELISSYPPSTQLYQRLFRFFVSRYSGTLTKQDVEDVLQETWVRAWQNANTFYGLASPETFFSKTAGRLALLAIRQRSRQGGSTSLSLSDPEDPRLFNQLILPDNQAVITFLKQVLKLMGEMNPDQSLVLILIALGMEYHEIANVLGVPLGTVQSRLSRARANLIDRLNRIPSPMKAAA